MPDDLHVLDEQSGLWLPKPPGRQLTQIWVQHIGTIRVVDSYDSVVDSLSHRPCTFTDLFDEPVYLTADAVVVAVTVEWQDLEVIRMDMKERELGKRMREQQLTRASFEAAAAAKKQHRLN